MEVQDANLILLGRNGRDAKVFLKNVCPSINYASAESGFVVHEHVTLPDSAKMHDLEPGIPGGESSMEYSDNNLDLTETTSSFNQAPNRQPLSIDSGPHGILANQVTSSSSIPSLQNPSASSIPSQYIQCKMIELSYDSNITQMSLSHLLGPKSVILLLLDPSLLQHPDDDDTVMAQYKDILEMVQAVSCLHGTQYKVILAGYHNQHESGKTKNIFCRIRHLALGVPGLENVFLGVDLIYNKPEFIDNLYDVLREVSGAREESFRNYKQHPKVEYLRTDQTPDNIEDREKALIVFSLLVKEVDRKMGEKEGNEISNSFIKSAVQPKPAQHNTCFESQEQLYVNVDSHVSDLVKMGCLIPSHKKGIIQPGRYILPSLTEKSASSFFPTNDGANASAILRIQVQTPPISGNIPSSILISFIVSECLRNSWDIAKQGRIVFQNCVAFQIKHGSSIRLLLSIENEFVYLDLFDYSECKEGISTPFNRTCCQKFLELVTNAIYKLYDKNVTLIYSVQCQKSKGGIEASESWIEVEDLREMKDRYYCQCGPIMHKVPLKDSLHVWFSNQTDSESSQSQGLPDSTVGTEIPDNALPDVAACFGAEWNLFFISRNVSNVFIDRLQSPNVVDNIHKALRVLKENYEGGLSFKVLRKLVVDRTVMHTFDFTKYDKIVKRFTEDD